MRKYFIGSFVALALLMGGVSVSAATLSESQIQSIMGLLSSFGADASVVENVDVSLHGGKPAGPGTYGFPYRGDALPPPVACVGEDSSCTNMPTMPTPPEYACPVPVGPLVLGNAGSDVIALQNFLAQDASVGYSAGATGYFGPITMQALQRWQASQGIVTSGSAQTTGFGAVGPRTIAAMNKRCGNPGNPGMQLRASPTSGKAPLTVKFATQTTPNSNSGTYVVDFGDDSSAPMESNGMVGICVVGAGGPCNGYNGLEVSHTYKTNGTYTAKLMYDNCPKNAQCFVGPRVVSSVTIAVGGTPPGSILPPPTDTNPSDSGVLHASPTSGNAPLNVSFWYPSPGIPSEVGNPVGLKYAFDFGDGTTAEAGNGCGPNPSYNGMSNMSCMVALTGSHIYTTSGTYTAKLIKTTDLCGGAVGCAAPVGMTTLGTATIMVGVSSSGAGYIPGENCTGSYCPR